MKAKAHLNNLLISTKMFNRFTGTVFGAQEPGLVNWDINCLGQRSDNFRYRKDERASYIIKIVCIKDLEKNRA